MKLAIGSAQIGMNYGFLNNKKISRKEFKKIEKLILDSKINFIDTATSYGDSEYTIGNSRLKNLNIITKIKLPSNKNIRIKKWILKKILKSLNKLKIKKVYGVLIHDYKDLLGKHGRNYLICLQELKKKKIIKKIGISVYDPQEIKKIWKFWKPDLIQVPFNILDNRIVDSGWINILKKFKVKIFVRSVFLQGLLINDNSHFEINKNYRILLNKFKNWCYKNNISLLKASVHFVKQFKKIDYLIVGFNNYNQLKEIIDVFKKKKIIIPKKFSTNKKNLIDPRKWNSKLKF
jgi:aryl-alcohol dehydrogenase-like predicted oxidoreductase